MFLRKAWITAYFISKRLWNYRKIAVTLFVPEIHSFCNSLFSPNGSWHTTLRLDPLALGLDTVALSLDMHIQVFSSYTRIMQIGVISETYLMPYIRLRVRRNRCRWRHITHKWLSVLEYPTHAADSLVFPYRSVTKLAKSSSCNFDNVSSELSVTTLSKA